MTMRILACVALGLVFPAMTLPAAAGEKFDAAARAKTIAPFLDEETVAGVHVDLARVAPGPLFPPSRRGGS
jgi:hypothetical protein